MGGPEVDVYRVQNGEERKTPPNTVNDDLLAALEELVDNGTEKQEVDE